MFQCHQNLSGGEPPPAASLRVRAALVLNPLFTERRSRAAEGQDGTSLLHFAAFQFLFAGASFRIEFFLVYISALESLFHSLSLCVLPELLEFSETARALKLSLSCTFNPQLKKASEEQQQVTLPVRGK